MGAVASALTIWVLVLHPEGLAGVSPALMVDPGAAYGSAELCETRAKFFRAYVPLAGEFKCERFEVSQ